MLGLKQPRIDERLGRNGHAKGLDLEVQMRRTAAGVTGVPDESQDVAAVDRQAGSDTAGER